MVSDSRRDAKFSETAALFTGYVAVRINVEPCVLKFSPVCFLADRAFQIPLHLI